MQLVDIDSIDRFGEYVTTAVIELCLPDKHYDQLVLGVPAAKDGSRARASQLMPAATHHWPLVKHDGRAEAALIGHCGLSALRRVTA
jgi:hypothetical protein